MPCASCGGGQIPTVPEQMYEVTLPNGEVKVLNDHDSRVAMTMAGGGERRAVAK